MKVTFLAFLLMIFFAGSVLGGLIIHVLDSPFLDELPINYQTLHFPETNSNIYMTARIWGLTSDHEEVRFCTRPIDFQKSFENNECVKFYADKAFYRRERPNVLHIYVAYSSIPDGEPKRLGEINVRVHELKNFDRIRELETNYDEQGLSMIAAPF